MQLQVHADGHISVGERLTKAVEESVSANLGRFEDQLTRVEAHLSDVNGPKAGGLDKRCLLEARPAGLAPIVASHDAPTVEEAVEGAAEKLRRALESTLGRLGNVKGRTSFGGDQTI